MKKDEPNYKSKRKKTYNFGKCSLPIDFLMDIHEGHLPLENADLKQSNFVNELKNFEKGTKTLEKETFPDSFKSRLFPNLDKIPTCEQTPKPATEPEVAKEPENQK